MNFFDNNSSLTHKQLLKTKNGGQNAPALISVTETCGRNLWEVTTMFNESPKCSVCGKEIEGDEVVFIKMRYPKRKGFTEVKAYLKNEGQLICEGCYEKK